MLALSTPAARRAAVSDLISLGLSFGTVAARLGISRRHVRRIAARTSKKMSPLATGDTILADRSNFAQMPECVEFDADGNRTLPGYWSHPADALEPLPDSDCQQTRIRVAALRYLTQVENRPYSAVAREIGCTKAAISKWVVILSDRLGIQVRVQKDAAARANMRAARVRSVAAAS